MASEKKNIMNASELGILLWDALAASEQDIELDEEYMYLLASGRIRDIPDTERKKLLAQIANNPMASELLSQLYHDFAHEKSSRVAQSKSKQIYRITTVAWAAAACLVICLFVSMEIFPTQARPPSVHHTPSGTTEEGPDYWSQLDKKRLYMESQWQNYRDFALVASTSACLILSAGLVLCGLSRLRNLHKKTD